MLDPAAEARLPAPVVPVSHQQRVPLVIGMSGHRDPLKEYQSKSKELFEAVLDAIALAAPNTPLVLLNGLATGCDQLAAEWATDWSDRQGPWQGGTRLIIVGVLPMLLDECRTDFPEPQREALRTTLSHCAYALELPVQGLGTASSGDPGDTRNRWYDQHAAFIASQSSVVLAFWNGEDTQKPGGTASVIRRALSGTCDVARDRFGLDVLRRYAYQTQKSTLMPDGPYAKRQPWALSLDAVRTLTEWMTPCFAIPTPRERVETRGFDQIAVLSQNGSPQDWVASCSVARLLQEFEFINKGIDEAHRNDPSPPAPVTPSELPLLEAANARIQSLGRAAGCFTRALESRARIEIGLLAGAFGCFAVVSSFGDSDYLAEASSTDGALPWIASAALMLLCCVQLILVWWWIERSKEVKHERKRSLARALEQCLSVQRVIADEQHHEQVGNWMLARTADHTNPLRALLHGAGLELIAHDARRSTAEVDTRSCAQDWIEGQIKYFTSATAEGGKRRQSVRRSTRVKVLSKYAVLFSYVALLLLIIVPTLFGAKMNQEWWIDGACLTVSAALILALVVEMLEGVSPVEQDLESFRHMLGVHERAKRALFSHSGCGTNPGDSAERRRVLNDLGKEAIDEYTEWYVQHRERQNEFRLG